MVDYTLSFVTWTSRKPKQVPVGNGLCVTDCNDQETNFWPVVQAKWKVTAKFRSGKTSLVGQSCGQRYVSNRWNLLRIVLPQDPRNVTSLSLEYERGANSTEGAILNVQKLYARLFWPPRLAIFSRRNESTALEPGKPLEFRRSCWTTSLAQENDLVPELQDRGVLCDEVDDDEDAFDGD